MVKNPTDQPSFMDQVMEICDRILEKQPGLSGQIQQEQHPAPSSEPGE